MSKGKVLRKVSHEELQKHKTAQDCWMVVENKVYDVSKFVKYHPGGKVITQYAGGDATDPFYAFHGHNDTFPAWQKLPAFLVGELEKPIESPPHIEDFRKLRKDLIDKGYFDPNYLWYLMIA